MNVKHYIQAFARSFDHPEFSGAVLKWQPLIESTAYQIAKITRQDVEDALQTILLDLVSVADYFINPLYRYKNRVWCVRQQSGRLALIESPKHIVQRMTPRWLYRACLTPLRKSTASAFVYRRIIQCLPDTATKYFRQRNGFETTRITKLVVEKSGTTRRTRLKEVSVPVQKYRPVVLDELENVSASGYNPEDICVAAQLLDGVSDTTQKIAKLLLTGGLFADTVLSKRSGLCVRQVVQAKAELHRRLTRQRYPAGCTPVYFRAEQVK